MYFENAHLFLFLYLTLEINRSRSHFPSAWHFCPKNTVMNGLYCYIPIISCCLHSLNVTLILVLCSRTVYLQPEVAPRPQIREERYRIQETNYEAERAWRSELKRLQQEERLPKELCSSIHGAWNIWATPISSTSSQILQSEHVQISAARYF